MNQSLHILLSKRSLSFFTSSSSSSLSLSPSSQRTRCGLLVSSSRKCTIILQQSFTTKSNNNKNDPSSTSSSTTTTTNNKNHTKNKKENFAKKFLDPAARGELNKHHGTGIPKLAARKSKGHEVKDDFPSGKKSDEILMEFDDFLGNAAAARGGGGGATSTSTTTSSSKGKGGQRKSGGNRQKQDPLLTNTTAFTRKSHPRKEDLTHLFQGPKPEDLDPLLTQYDASFIGASSDSIKSRLFQQQRNLKQGSAGGKGGGGRRGTDIWGDEISEEEMNDPWPTPYISHTREFVHAESRREPRPIAHPSNRLNPTSDFIAKYKAFAYITNVPLPTFTHDNQEVVGKFDNPLHRHQVAETVANAMNIPVVDVFPATMTSAFVGFDDARIASDVYNKSESRRVIQLDIQSSIYSEKDGNNNGDKDLKAFISSAASKDSIIELQNLPAGMNPRTIVHLFRKVTKLTTDDIYFVTPTKVLLKQSSAEDATTLTNRSSFLNLIKSLSRQILRVQPAKLEVLHDKFGGPARQFQFKKTTNKLIVDGDVPSHKFFISHASVLHLSNVNPSITKQELSKYFQQYCIQTRDVHGSIEFVKSIDGHPTGRVYVGFDLASERDRAWDALCKSGQKIVLNGNSSPIRVRPVTERGILRGTKLGERTERSEEELLASLQSSWQDHVDPKDIELLESFGVTRDVLEDAFLSARYNNPTFGAEDLARSGERMHADKIPGQEYSDFVKLYVETMKELASTRDNPGAMYEGMFLPGEDMDYDLFDEEEERLKKLRDERDKLV